MNTQELRAALTEQERCAPQEQDILVELARLRRPAGGGRRRRARLTGMLAAAAVVAITVGLTALATHPASLPGGPRPVASSSASTPSTPSTPSTSISGPPATTAPAAELPAQSRARQLAQQAAQAAAESAEQEAQAAANGARTALTTCSSAASGSVLTAGKVDAAKVAAAVDACAQAFGARPGYRVEWVQSTLGSVQTLVTGHPEGGDRAVVAVQVDGIFVRAGQPAEHETMLLIFFLDGGTSTGVDAPINPIDLSTLGVVHRT